MKKKLKLKVVSTTGTKKFKKGTDLEKVKARWGAHGATDEEIITSMMEKNLEILLDKLGDEEYSKRVAKRRQEKDRELLKGKFLIHNTEPKDIN